MAETIEVDPDGILEEFSDGREEVSSDEVPLGSGTTGREEEIRGTTEESTDIADGIKVGSCGSEEFTVVGLEGTDCEGFVVLLDDFVLFGLVELEEGSDFFCLFLGGFAGEVSPGGGINFGCISDGAIG